VKKPQGLGERIAQSRRVLGVREQRDVTQLDLAKAAGVSGPTVSDWEAGKKVPREAALMKLADYLGVSPAFLRYGVTDTVTVGGLEIDRASLHKFTEVEIAEARRALERRESERAALIPAKKANGGKRRPR
jgi:transcriptional regulator with XRE-family HTH domain